MRIKKPKEDFHTYMKRRSAEVFYEDLSDIYACGYLALSRKNLSLKEKRSIQAKIEQVLEKRILYFSRKYKNARDKWVHAPAYWDERNKTPIRKIFKRVERMK